MNQREPVSILPGPDSVLHMTEVTVRRTPAMLLDAVNWNVEVDQRWVILGPNGAGKTTLLQVAAGQLFPTSGRVHILGERLGAVDIGELRPRIGLSSAALAGRVPPQERVLDVVVSAGYGVVGRWRESYDDQDFDRGRGLLDAMGIAALADRTYGTLSEGRPPAWILAAGRICWPGWAGWPSTRTRRRPSWSRITSRRSRPRSAMCCCCGAGRWWPPGRWRTR